MERTEQLVRSCMIAEKSAEDLNILASDIVNGRATLLHVVKALGDYLTAENDAIRTNAVELLSEVLEKCPPNTINRQSTRVLTVFYCEKMDDTETIIPALKGLAALVFNTSFTSEDTMTTVKAIFRHVRMRAHVQSTRLIVFTIIDTLMARNREALKILGNEFLRGYIDIAEGEKDPRNLLLAFSIARVILVEFEILNYVDELFNITFCYFPISFRPPADDPYGITSEDLKIALRSCLNATPRFGSLAMPLFLEKLSAGSGSTKRDTMQTITSCLPVYGVVVSRHHASKLWTALKVEVFQPIDSETAECALETVKTLIRVIYSKTEEEPTANGVPQGSVKLIVEECLDILKEPEKSKAKPAIQVLAVLMQTTSFITRYTVSKTVPRLIDLFRDPKEIANSPATLTALATIVQAACGAFTAESNVKETRSYEPEMPLIAVKDELLGVFTVGLKNSASYSPALMGLKALVGIPGLLTDEEIGFVVHSINEVLNSPEGIGEDVRTAVLDVLLTVSMTSPKHIEETTLPLLFSSLPDTAPPREANTERAKYRRILTSLSKLCIQPPLFETLVIRLSTKIEFICSTNVSLAIDHEASAAYAHSMISSLSTVIATKTEAGHVDMPKYVDRLVPRLYNIFITAAVTSQHDYVATHPRLIEVAAKVVAQVVQTLPIAQRQTFAGSLFKAWFDGELNEIADGHQRLTNDKEIFAPFDGHANATQKMLIPMFSAPVITFQKEISLPVYDEASWLSMLLDWSVSKAESEIQAFAAMHTVASMVNKHAEALDDFITSQLDSFWTHNIVKNIIPLARRRRGVKAWTWLTKALVVRNHTQSKAYVDKLFDIFGDEGLGLDAAKAVGGIGSGGENVLTKKNFAILTVLSVQKFFNSVLPRILAGAKTTNDVTQRTPYLVALASLIKSVSKDIYRHDMPKLMPLLLRGLDLQDTEMRADVIETMHSAAQDSSASGEAVQIAILEHAPSLVTAMLRNSSTTYLSSIRLRKAALRCLAILPHVVRYDILHPYRSQVIRDLSKCLDDPKRDVRKEAVDARENWYRYSG